jgi:chromosome segregation ATPase
LLPDLLRRERGSRGRISFSSSIRVARCCRTRAAASAPRRRPRATDSCRRARVSNDELEFSRSPIDQYLLDKEAREAANAAQAAADAIASEKAMAGLKMPATAEETRRAIDDAQQDIDDQNDALSRLNKELDSAPAEQKAGIQREIDRHTTGVQTSQQDLKALQDHLKQLNSKSTGTNSADSSKQPSQ